MSNEEHRKEDLRDAPVVDSVDLYKLDLTKLTKLAADLCGDEKEPTDETLGKTERNYGQHEIKVMKINFILRRTKELRDEEKTDRKMAIDLRR